MPSFGWISKRGNAVKRMKSGLMFTAAMLAYVGVAPASAQAPAPTDAVGSPVLAATPDVVAAYDTLRIQPIWVRGGVENPAVAQLVAILQRAPFDDFPEGPQLAAQVQTAAAQARSAPASAASADRVISSAWVRYVQALKRPTKGMPTSSKC